MSDFAALPLWVRLGPLAYAACAFVLSLAVGALVPRVAGLGSALAPGLHWSERARRAWPATGGTFSSVVLAVVIWGLTAGAAVGPTSLLPAPAVALVTAAAAYLGLRLGARGAMRRLRPEYPRRPLATVLRRLLVHWPLAVVFLVTPWAAGAEFGLRTAIVGACDLAALFLFASGGPLRLGQSLGLVDRPSAKLQDALERACASGRARPRLVAEVSLATYNAMALPLVGGLVVARELVEFLNEEELAAVLGHELGHLEEPRGLTAVRLGLVGAMLAVAVCLVPVYGAGGWPALAALVVALAALALLSRRIARRGEVDSDEAIRADRPLADAYAIALGELGRCDEARAAFAEARRRPSSQDDAEVLQHASHTAAICRGDSAARGPGR